MYYYTVQYTRLSRAHINYAINCTACTSLNNYKQNALHCGESRREWACSYGAAWTWLSSEIMWLSIHSTANLPLHYKTINIIMHNTCSYVHHSETSYIRADKIHNYELYSKGTTMYTLSFLTTWPKLYKHLVYTTREIMLVTEIKETPGRLAVHHTWTGCPNHTRQGCSMYHDTKTFGLQCQMKDTSYLGMWMRYEAGNCTIAISMKKPFKWCPKSGF